MSRTLSARDAAAVAVARFAAAAARLAGRGGTSLPGLIATRISPGVDVRVARGLRGSVLVSGTNGKTATASMLAAILAGTGHPVLANASGANLRQAIGTVLVRSRSLRGRARARDTVAVLEVDEAVLPGVRAWLPGGITVMTNLYRDQLDRFGETDHLVRLWTAMLAGTPRGGTIVYCVDDPRLAALVAGHGAELRGFGLAGPPSLAASAAVTGEVHACPSCGAPLAMAWTGTGHLGDYACTACGFRRPEPHLSVAVAERRGLDGQTLRFAWAGVEAGAEASAGAEFAAGVEVVELRLPGLGNAYNAAAAVSAAVALGVPPRTAVRALATARTPFGRFERVEVGGRHVVLSLLKNPASMGELANAAAGAPVDTLLLALNNAHADGRDVSWYWDCTPSALLAGRRFLVAGDRAADFALRVRYAVLDAPGDALPGFLGLIPDPVEALDRAVAETSAGGTVLVVATYTALLGIRASLVARSLAPAMPR